MTPTRKATAKTTPQRTLDAFREALETIAGYVLPVAVKDGERVVPERNAVYLRELAREALADDQETDD